MLKTVHVHGVDKQGKRKRKKKKNEKVKRERVKLRRKGDKISDGRIFYLYKHKRRIPIIFSSSKLHT